MLPPYGFSKPANLIRVSLLFPIGPLDEAARLQLLYDRLAARFDLGPATVRLSRRKLTGGEIVYANPHRITISAHLSESERGDTLRHEAAHAWAFKLSGARAGHGALFWKLAGQLGARRAPAPETEALRRFREKKNVVYRCEGCLEIFRRFRIFRSARFCVACHRAGRPSRLRRVPVAP
jgi:predicted SprT family Zn-dependent metalloprotease